MTRGFGRFEKYIYPVPFSGCWLWNGQLNGNRYGMAHYDGKHQVAHRAVYEDLVGPIGEGLQLDHLCRVTACVNPDHLEPVTRHENVLRSRATLNRDGVCYKCGSPKRRAKPSKPGTLGNLHCLTCTSRREKKAYAEGRRRLYGTHIARSTIQELEAEVKRLREENARLSQHLAAYPVVGGGS